MSSERERLQYAGSADIAVGLFGLALGTAALLLVPSEVSPQAFRTFGDVRSPAFFPLIASGLLILFSAALLLRARSDRTRNPFASIGTHPRVAVVGALLLAGGVLVTSLGFLLTASALIVSLSLAFGARNYALVLGLAVAVPAAIHLLFRSVLNVLLPSGVLF